MFHDNLYPPETLKKYHESYGKMANAVGESLRSYLWVVGQVNEQFKATGKDTHLVVSLLLLEYAEPIDSVSILARQGAAKGCVPLIRTGFELQLGLRYIMQNDTDFENRCLSYEFFHWQKQLKIAQKCDPNSTAGKQVRGQLKGTFLADALDHPEEVLKIETAHLEGLVNHSRYAAIKAEYDRKPPKHWYGMWGGPANIEALAAKVGLADRYEILYRYWSAHAHGESVVKRVEENTSGGMDPVRCPRGLPDACLQASTLANEMAYFLADRYAPGLKPELGERYKRHIKPGIDYAKSVKGL